MSHTDKGEGLHLESCVHQVRGFVRDRCSDIRGFLKLDKRVKPEGNISNSPFPQVVLSSTSSHSSGSTSRQHAHVGPVHKSPGTPDEAHVSREELGRATWLLLHTLAAQYPDKPSKQQRKDVNAMVDLMTRVYPCGECAEHFQSIVRDHAPATESGPQLRQWMCKAHNAVNSNLGKPQFNCQFIDARWGGVECEGETACVLFGGHKQ